jgi:hypothetical protein
MTLDIGTSVRLDGAIRNPDREGAVAHLDLDRGFALVARASLSGIDVIDPTIWVREKLSLALAGAVDEPPLRALLGALRSVHGEIMKRPERDRTWISVGALLFHGDDGVAIAAGDTPCLRFRDGALASLGRSSEEWPAGAPRGSLGSETQVRIEVVPLRPVPGDVYLLTTRPLREGELAVLARALEGARTPGAVLRAALEGSFDTGRLAFRVLAPGEARTGPDEGAGGGAARAAAEEELDAALEIEPMVAPVNVAVPRAIPTESAPATEITPPAEIAPPAEIPPSAEIAAPTQFVQPAETTPEPAEEAPDDEASFEPASHPPFIESASGIGPQDDVDVAPPGAASEPDAEPATRRAPARPHPMLATVGEERPWYEPLALWGGGALAIIALALLVKAILPGILGPTTPTAGNEPGGKPPVATATQGTTMEILSEPPGALVRLNGEPLPGRTPMSAIAVDPGIHRVELDWGAGGTWSDTVEVAAGARLTLHPAIYGSIAFRASEANRVLDVYVDGAYAGTTPLALDRVTVGRHLIRFGGPGLTMTAQEVDVLRDVHVELVGNAGPLPAPGKLTVKSAILGDEGFQPGKSDPIWIDGAARGATPFTANLQPGMHSVRVVRRDFPAQVTVIEVKPGNEHFVTAEFGARSGEPLRFTPPDNLSRSQPTPLTISLPGDAADAEHSVWLYAAAPGGSFQARAMTRLAEDARAYAALVPDEVLKNASRQIRVYFKATAPGGHEIYSEIHTIPIRD